MTSQRKSTAQANAFLECLAKTGCVGTALRMSGLPRSTAYKRRNQDETFAEQWDEALEAATDILEQEARRRAFEGIEEAVWYQGQEVGTVRKYSDTLLIFLLNGNRPQKYKRRYEHSGDPNNPVVLKAVDMTDEQLLAIAAKGQDETKAGTKGSKT